MSKNLPSILHPYPFAMYLSIRRAIRSLPDLKEGGGGVVMLLAPEGTDVDDYVTPLARYLSNYEREKLWVTGQMVISAAAKTKSVLNAFDDKCRDARHAIIIAEFGAQIPAQIALATDHTVKLEPISATDVQIACRVCLSMRMSDVQATQALSYPPDLLWAAMRRGRTAEAVLERLNNAHADAEAPSRRGEVQRLSTMHGYGSAKTWGMELARDLVEWRNGDIDWSDVDKGVVLSGPPGVGKTVFAKAVALECEVPLVATSLGRWQAHGHLGDLLKAMRQDFRRAKEAAPSILFIDELDSFGDRDNFTKENQDYCTQVVNAFLELLDGLEGRDGVVVIGATNNPARIDPAILRSGRLDRHLKIGLPDADQRIEILHQQTAGQLTRQELASISEATRGLTGADLAKTVRDANRAARREKRDLVISDIRSSLPAMLPIEGALRRTFAIHEAGHTVAAIRLKLGTYQGTMLNEFARNTADHEQAGGAFIELPRLAVRSSQYYRDYILILLAGLAAEEAIFGYTTDGAGVGETSDLATATRVATQMQSSMGMGTRLRHSVAKKDKELEDLRHADASVAEWVDAVLESEFERAKKLMRENEVFVNAIADLLMVKSRVLPEEVYALDSEVANATSCRATV